MNVIREKSPLVRSSEPFAPILALGKPGLKNIPYIYRKGCATYRNPMKYQNATLNCNNFSRIAIIDLSNGNYRKMNDNGLS